MATLSTHFHCKTITSSSIPKTSKTSSSHSKTNNRRLLILTTTTSLTSLFCSSFQYPSFSAESNSPKPSSSLLSGIANTKSWFQFYGDGFVIRVPPYFQDVMEPEDYNSGLSLYGDKVKPKTFAARFASPDGSEVVSVVTRPTNQLKITFLEVIGYCVYPS
ncbi:hypothetical protein Leryth_018022 [Lithospermum erythrorhizon]|nr:hypothetical protein Leryth_018022 [Lithospermum erythrorhizon]